MTVWWTCLTCDAGGTDNPGRTGDSGHAAAHVRHNPTHATITTTRPDTAQRWGICPRHTPPPVVDERPTL